MCRQPGNHVFPVPFWRSGLSILESLSFSSATRPLRASGKAPITTRQPSSGTYTKRKLRSHIDQSRSPSKKSSPPRLHPHPGMRKALVTHFIKSPFMIDGIFILMVCHKPHNRLTYICHCRTRIISIRHKAK